MVRLQCNAAHLSSSRQGAPAAAAAAAAAAACQEGGTAAAPSPRPRTCCASGAGWTCGGSCCGQTHAEHAGHARRLSPACCAPPWAPQPLPCALWTILDADRGQGLCRAPCACLASVCWLPSWGLSLAWSACPSALTRDACLWSCPCACSCPLHAVGSQPCRACPCSGWVI